MIMLSPITTLQKIYPKHIFIPLVGADLQRLSPSQVDLNRVCLKPIQHWINHTLGLTVQLTFPSCLNFTSISKLVNGFVWQVGEIRIVFIPSDAIDIEEFEVPQEWVDLPNWMGSYYVPVRIDLEQKYLHLWGFITHDDLRNQARFDRIFRNYHVSQSQIVANLDLLRDYCQLDRLSEPKIDTQYQLSTLEMEDLIHQLQSRRSRFSPRLDLPFTHWGAIINESYWLERYLNPEIDLSIWWKSTQSAIIDGWELIENFINPPQAIPVLNVLKKLPTLNKIKGVFLSSDREIKTAITELYYAQTELMIPEEPIEIDHLIPLLQNCRTDKIWWRAAEYLWTIQPEHPFLTTRIRQLEPQFTEHSIALMISMIPTLNDRTAVLVRLYSATGTHLPPGLQLTIQDEFGKNLLTNPHGEPYIATARTDIKDSCIQLYFAADPGDRFVSCITLDEVKEMKTFKLQQSHSQ